jgi:putative flavoprotein involved in K+ transport
VTVVNEREHVLVVGAGPAGLGTAAELQRRGIPVTVLERADVLAAPWRSRHDRLRLNTSRPFSQLPGLRFPRSAGMFPSRDHFVQYLEAYAAHHGIDVRLGTPVLRIDPVAPEDDGCEPRHRWAVRTPRGELVASDVVVATGLLQVPFIPDWPGRSRFLGDLVHAAAYRNPVGFQGRDVLVVGAGCSGMEIAAELADGGARRVRLAVRTPPNILLRSIGGLPGDPAAMLLLRVPPRVADAQMALLRRLVLGDLTRHGLPAPAEGPFRRLARTGEAPTVVDRDVLTAIRAGRLEVVAGVTALDERGARLADGNRADVDTVIAATGYRTGLAPLVGHLGVLDDRGRPLGVAADQTPAGLWFIGFRAGPGQIGALGGQARRIATAIDCRTGPGRRWTSHRDRPSAIAGATGRQLRSPETPSDLPPEPAPASSR